VSIAGAMLPVLPDSWQKVQMRRVMQIENGADYKSVEVAEGGYPVYGSGGVFRRAGEFLYDGESVLFGRKGTIDRPIHVNERFWTVDTMYYTRLRDNVAGRFLYYYATTIPYWYYTTSTALPSMTQTNLAGHVMPLPPLVEQRAIADYLDDATAKIDSLIANQHEMIGLLEERRVSEIAHAVAGLRSPHKGVKESGLNWVPSIAAHIPVANIRRFAAMRTGHTPSRSNAEYWVDCTIPWFTLADVWQLRSGTVFTASVETSSRISELGLANSAAELLPADTVMLSRTASVGFSGIMPTSMATSQDFWNWICGPRLLPKYLLWTFRAMKPEFDAIKAGSTHQTIYQPIAAALKMPVPSVGEQREIVDYLDFEVAKIDALIAKTHEHIALAKERRSALITAAVTGQFDVRNASARGVA